MIKIKPCVGFLLTLLVFGCAYSPQQIIITPSISATDEVYGQNRIINVLFEDQRSNKVIGSRGGAYPDTSIITPSNDINAAMIKATKQGLRQQGFVIDEQQTPAATMKIILNTLSYEQDEESITSKVNLTTVLLLEVVVADKTYRGRYKSASSHQLVVNPSAEKNELLINTALSETLQRSLSDPKVKAFLSNS
ncbi:MAG: putative lipoprotein [Pseudohongiellaceae bacterium]|jgi:uncharacterized lipoprotein